VRSSRASDDLAVDGYGGASGAAAARPSLGSRIWNRQLPHYPDTRPRTFYLAVTVLATIMLYYELYIQGAVATQIINDFHMSFTYFVFILVIGNAVGAFASLGAGLADRWGRANLVTYGLLLTALLILVGMPNAGSKFGYGVMFALVSLVEGVVLVATPALIRDFSPQIGRAAAMGFWTMGPVLGSLVVTEVSSHTLDSHPDWRWQFYLCGTIGLIVFVISFFGLRELSPRLRDQLMVSMRDRALIEARAAGISPEEALQGQWRQMLRFDVVGGALSISLFLLLYYMAVAFTVVYFATVFGYSEARANSLANWYWIANAIALIFAGLTSDFFRVRKPFMIIGACISLVGGGLFAAAATKPETGYYTFAIYFILLAVGGGLAYCCWMAAFTETVEKHNPAATATGLAVWGWILRLVVTASFAIFSQVTPATSTLVDTQQQYPEQVAILQRIDQTTAAALQANPTDPTALPAALGQVAHGDALAKGQSTEQADALQADVQQTASKRINELTTANAIDPATLKALSDGSTDPALIAKAQGEIASALHISSAAALGKLLALAAPAVKADLTSIQPYITQLQFANTIPPAQLASLAKAQKDNPKQWQHWWWVCFAGQVVFIPFVFVLSGRWSPRKARNDEQEHERFVESEMARLGGQHVAPTAEGGAAPA